MNLVALRIAVAASLLIGSALSGASAAPQCPTSQIRFGGSLCEPARRAITSTGTPFNLLVAAHRVSVACEPAQLVRGDCPAEFAPRAAPFDFDAYTYENSFIPPVWSVEKTLDTVTTPPHTLGVIAFTLDNQLPPASAPAQNGVPQLGRQPTNIHTHGLIVSPGETTVGGKERYGDNVFVLACSSHGISPSTPPTSPGAITTLCDEVAVGAPHGSGAVHSPGEHSGGGHEIHAGRVEYAIPVSSLQPPGLAWFHPHAHTLSAMQVGAGLSGLISIGDLCAFPTLTNKSRAGWCDRNGAVSHLKPDVTSRTLMLKDVQVIRSASVFSPLQTPPAKPTSAGAIISVSCLGAPGTYGDGWCRYSRDPLDVRNQDKTPDQSLNASEAGDWLFTVNGQVAPRIDMVPGRQEVWRLANVGSNTAYRLALCKLDKLNADDAGLHRWKGVELSGGPQGDGYHELRRCDEADRLPFQVVSLDGAASFGLKDGGTQPLPDREFTLLPGTRAEIVVTLPPEAAGTYALAQLGFNFPDMWPATVLAHLEAKPFTSPAPGPLPPLEFLQAAAAAPAHDPAFPPRAQEKAPKQDPDTIEVSGDATVAIVFGRYVDNDRPSGADPEVLVLKAIVVDGTKPANEQLPGMAACLDKMRPNPNDDPRALPECQSFIGKMFEPTRLDLKVKFGSKVTFSFFNLTTELHNFHIHQQKFNITRTGVEDLPATALAEATAGAAPAHATARLSAQPPKAQASLGPYAATLRAVALRVTAAGGGTNVADGTVDSLPAIPIFFTDGDTHQKIGGVAQAVVTFDKPQQIGTFVFHCHILEHEDKGMMNTISVVR